MSMGGKAFCGVLFSVEFGGTNSRLGMEQCTALCTNGVAPWGRAMELHFSERRHVGTQSSQQIRSLLLAIALILPCLIPHLFYSIAFDSQKCFLDLKNICFATEHEATTHSPAPGSLQPRL